MKKTTHKTKPPRAAIVNRIWFHRDDSHAIARVMKFAIADRDVEKCLVAELSKPKSTVVFDLNKKLQAETKKHITSTSADSITVELVNPCEKLTSRGELWQSANETLADFFGADDILKAEVASSGDTRPSRMEYAVMTDADLSDGKVRMTPDVTIRTFDDEDEATTNLIATANKVTERLNEIPGFAALCGLAPVKQRKRKATNTFILMANIGKKQFVSVAATKRQVWL